MGLFSKVVEAWGSRQRRRLDVVRKESTKELARRMTTTYPDRTMPVRTGNLRSSLMVSTTAVPPVDPSKMPEPGKTYPWDLTAVFAAIDATNIKQTIHLGFVAPYARRMEYGFNGQDSLGRTYHQRGYGFVRRAALEWQEIVREQDRIFAANNRGILDRAMTRKVELPDVAVR